MKYLYIFVFLFLLFTAPPAQGGKGDLPLNVMEGPLRGTVLRVVDGDTIDVKLRIWLGQDVVARVRLEGIDAPELHGKCARERALAQAAKAALEKQVADKTVVLSGIQHEKYAGRVLARVETREGRDVANNLLEGGFVRAYHGEKRQSWCDP